MTRGGPSARHWSWGADLVAPTAQALMETTWLYAWAVIMASVFKAASPGFLAMVLLLALGAWSGRLSGFVPWRPPWGRLLLVPATIVVLPAWLYAALPLPGGWSGSTLLFARSGMAGGALVGTCVLAFYLWGRGVWIGVRPPSTKTLGKWLVGGAAAYVALFALSAADHDKTVAPVAGRLELLVLGYFVLGLSVIAIVHTKTLHGRSSARQPISLSWAIALATPMAAIAALGLLFSSDLAPVMRAILAPAVRAAAAAALVVDRVLLWVGDWLLMFLHWLSRFFLAGAPGGALRRGPPLSLSDSRSNRLDEIILLFVYILLLGLIAAGLVSLCLRFLRHLRFLFRRRRSARDGAEGVDEERSSLWSWPLFRAQLRGVWAALFGRFRKGHGALAGWARAAIAGRRGEPDPADIREIYRRLLRWAAARGCRRAAATTPHELSRQISAAVPAATAAVALITAHYERARYGDGKITGPALAASRAASEEIAKADSQSAGVRARRVQPGP